MDGCHPAPSRADPLSRALFPPQCLAAPATCSPACRIVPVVSRFEIFLFETQVFVVIYQRLEGFISGVLNRHHLVIKEKHRITLNPDFGASYSGSSATSGSSLTLNPHGHEFDLFPTSLEF